MFNRSLLLRLRYHPFQTDAEGNVTQTLDGVFILCSPELVEILKSGLTQAEKDELQSYVYQITGDQAGLWHVPVWAGETSAVYIRVPAAVWNDPTSPPPLKVKRFFQHLWNEATT